MDQAPNLPALRRELESVARQAVDEHERLIEGLRNVLPHRIRLVERANPDREFACVMYALDLAETIAGKLSIARQPPAVIVRTELLDYMLWADLLEETDHESVSDGALVIYFNGSKAKHVGLVDAGDIRSKWGVGHVWRHPLLEVPEQYGSAIRFFKQVPQGSAVAAYESYIHRTYPKPAIEFARRQVG